MSKRKAVLYAFKSILITILFCSAVYFENAQQQRIILLVAIFLLYAFMGILRLKALHNKKLYGLSFLADIALIFILEYNSRLLINYFFHTFYIIVLLEATLTLPMRNGIIISSFSVLVSLIKYAYLIYYKFDLSSVSQMVFFLLVNVLILVTAAFAQYNREERERKDTLYMELLDAHRQLKRYTDEINRLTVVEERNRIARDIHDTLGHNMTALIMQLQMAEHLLKEDGSKAEELLLSAVRTAKESLGDIREVVETLRGSGASAVPADSVRRLADEFSARTGVDIRLDIIGTNGIKDTSVNAAVFHIIQEALTNAVRHGRATEIHVSLEYSEEHIAFCVRDNGCGAADIEEGYGLKGIRERVESFGGMLEYGTEDGFFVKGMLKISPQVKAVLNTQG